VICWERFFAFTLRAINNINNKNGNFIHSIREHWLVPAMLIFLGFYWLLFLAVLSGREEMIIEAGQESFTATLTQITAVIPCNNDVSLKELLDENGSDVSIVICDESGDTAAEIAVVGGEIHTNGYNSTENLQADGASFTLEKGKTYTLRYEASCGEVSLTDLSFVLYGEEHKLPVLSAVVWGLLLCILVIVKCCGCSAGGYRLLWLALSAVFLISAPKMNEKESERRAFAEAYAASNVILGQEAADADGYVYVEESGIRNMGYLSYSVPLHRFWSDWRSGNGRETGRVSSLYQLETSSSAMQGSALSYINGAAIALMRVLKAPYQLVYLSGKLLHMLIVFLLFSLFLSIWKRERAAAEQMGMTFYEFLPIFFLLPSMLQSSQSYHWGGVSVSVVLTAAAAAWSFRRKKPVCCPLAVLSAVIVLSWIHAGIERTGYGLRPLIRAVMEHADEGGMNLICSWSVSYDALRFPIAALICVLLYFFLIQPAVDHAGRDARGEGEVRRDGMRSGVPSGHNQRTGCRFMVILFLILYIGWKCIG
jgi:hypothetical protein